MLSFSEYGVLAGPLIIAFSPLNPSARTNPPIRHDKGRSDIGIQGGIKSFGKGIQVRLNFGSQVGGGTYGMTPWYHAFLCFTRVVVVEEMGGNVGRDESEFELSLRILNGNYLVGFCLPAMGDVD
jgi:hypothetical protein